MLHHSTRSFNKELVASNLPREEILEARKHFTVEVLSFDTSQRYGIEEPYADYVRLRITNNSNVTLPFLTVLTTRYDHGKRLGDSRAPSIPVGNIKPGESFEYDYYPKGHFDSYIANATDLNVEIEHIINDDEAQFFAELKQ
jgi:hypothetical protein